jgi:hypothetical protein
VQPRKPPDAYACGYICGVPGTCASNCDDEGYVKFCYEYLDSDSPDQCYWCLSWGYSANCPEYYEQ